MRECPILFSPWSVQRILANAKSQTRRVLVEPGWAIEGDSELEIDEYGKPICIAAESGCFAEIPCPHGVVGDHLWVKEPFSLGNAQDGRTPAEAWEHVKETKQGLTILYRAGGWKSVAPFEREEPVYKDDEPMPEWAGRRRHGMFMPRWASRITLEITDIRVQRVQEISEQDIAAEGVVIPPPFLRLGVDGYPIESKNCDKDPWWFWQQVWDSINGKDHPWSSNPWVWAISFRRMEAQ